MKTIHILAYICIGIVIEYFFRLMFMGYPIFIVPELIIFLMIINRQDKDIFIKFVYAAILYDLWASSQFGVIVVALFITFLVLYLTGRVSYVGDKKSLRGPSGNILILTIFSDFLFLVYYVSSHYVSEVSLGFHTDQISWAWRSPMSITTIQACVAAFAVFLCLYYFYKFSSRPKSFKP